MTVTSPKTEYTVLHSLKSAGGQSVYLARSSRPVLLVRVSDRATIKGAGEYFESLAGNGIVIETFARQRELWIALDNDGSAVGVRISKVLKGLSLFERNALAEKLVYIIYEKKLPWPLLYDCLSPEKVTVGPDGSVGLVCIPEIFPGYERDCRASCMSRLSELVRLIYGDTGGSHVAVFTDELDDMRYVSLNELAAGFRRLYSSIENMPIQVKEPPRLSSRLSALRKSLAARAVTLAAAALLIIGYITLGMAVYDAMVSVPLTGDISAIGTVELYEIEE